MYCHHFVWPFHSFYRPGCPSVETLAEDAADVLFRWVLGNGNRLLHILLPDKNSHGYNLRHRQHDRIIASNHDQWNFIDRQLHKHSYWLVTTSSSHSCWTAFCSVLIIKRICYVMLFDITDAAVIILWRLLPWYSGVPVYQNQISSSSFDRHWTPLMCCCLQWLVICFYNWQWWARSFY